MRIFTEQEKQFMQAHALSDVATLMLQAKRFPNLPVAELAKQIQARQKATSKLPTWVTNPDVIFPVTLSVEQSSSEVTAAYKASLVSGELLIDLTGGFGVDSFYFSKRFSKVIHVEQNQELSEIAAYNFELLGATNIETINKTAEDFLTGFAGMADVIYLDPARRGEHHEKVHLLKDCEPDVLNLLPVLLAKSKSVLLKTSPMLDIDLAIAQLATVANVWVVAVQNECKEVLYLLTSTPPEDTEREAVNILANGQVQQLHFNAQQEEQAKAEFSEPLNFIYEPNAAILKAGAYRYLAQYLNLGKLHPNSHLYTSQTLLADFPGRSFRCLQVTRYNKKELLPLLPHKKANITVRNFPESVADIRKKTGIKEGGNIYLFFTTTRSQKPVVLVCEKV
ncbi:class I SAM-dependent methyltransferase [Pontibacter vulgaris]|uniref:class I SAM-dependent methyltransferase n=1 Tax=Pontibacter vulgaris TaxID=2905679 RepID=UPI001FA6B2AC|nr:class I SAM-dependent methyltransferase [Pontibacter vulgaris]